MADTELYLITPPRIDPAQFCEMLKQACAGGPIAVLQLRLKDQLADTIKRATETLLPVCREHDITFLLNDHPELVTELGMDGVHLGEDDMPIAEARTLLGEDYAIGASCYGSLHRAMEAGEVGADYVAFGAFYPTTTKQPKARPEPALLATWHMTATLPSVAIGGITPENCQPLIAHGADFLAVIAGVWQYPQGPESAVKAFHQTIANTEVTVAL